MYKYEYRFSENIFLYKHYLFVIDELSEKILKKSKAKEIALNFIEMGQMDIK